MPDDKRFVDVCVVHQRPSCEDCKQHARSFLVYRVPVKVTLQKSDYLVAFDDGTSALYPRVTSILDILHKPALMWWAANAEREMCMNAVQDTYKWFLVHDVQENRPMPEVGMFMEELREQLGAQKAHQKQSRKALDIGAETHALIQHDLKGRLGKFEKEPEASDPSRLAFMAWEDWRDSVGFEPVSAETPLGSERLGVGGTNDAAGVAHYPAQLKNEQFLVCDWKSSKRSKTAPDGIYYESLVQVSTYRRMGIEMGLFPEDSLAAVVRLPKDLEDPVIKDKQPVDVRVLEPEEADDYVKDFEAYRAAWARLAMRGQA